MAEDRNIRRRDNPKKEGTVAKSRVKQRVIIRRAKQAKERRRQGE